MKKILTASLIFLFLACNADTELPKEASPEYIDSTNKVMENEIKNSKYRSDLISNALKMGMTKERAEAYADSIYQLTTTDSAAEAQMKLDLDKKLKDTSK